MPKKATLQPLLSKEEARPERDQQFNLRLSARDRSRLDALADLLEINTSEVLRRLIRAEFTAQQLKEPS